MINTVFVSASQAAYLTRLAGWQPFPWSPVVRHLGAHEPSPADIASMTDKGLLVDDEGGRVNTAIAVALAAVCEPDQQVEIALPNADPVYLCRAGTLTVGWHDYDTGGVALSFPLTLPDRHRLLTDLLQADAEPTDEPALELTASASELEILIAIGEHAATGSPVTADDLIRELLTSDRTATSESLAAAIADLAAAHLVDARRGPIALAGPAVMFGQQLDYGFLVKRLRMPDPTEPVITDALHVYRGSNALLVTRPVGTDAIECQHVNRRQLADMILTLTLNDDELAQIGTG